MKRIVLTLALVALSVCASAALHKSLMGAKKTAENGVAPAAWENPYITDGLVAMWDGEWNVDGGKHNNNALEWTDLSGNEHNATVPSAGCFDSNSYNFSKKSTFTDFSNILTNSTGITVEFIANITKMGNDSAGIYFSLGGIGISFGRYGSKGIFSYVYGGWTNNQFILPTPYPKSIVVVFRKGQSKLAWFDGVAPTATSEYWSGKYPSIIGNGNGGGQIYSIRVYDRALTEEEILFNYSIDKERFGI